MSQIGFPDYQQIQQWIGAPIINVNASGGTQDYGPFNVSSWRSLLVQFYPPALGTSRLTLTWNRDSLIGGPIQRSAYFHPAARAIWVVPNPLDRLAQLEQQTPNAPGGSLVVAPCNLDPVAFTTNDTGCLVQAAPTINASGVVVVSVPFYAGHAKLSFDPNDGSFAVAGESYDNTGTLIGLWLYDIPVTTRQLYDLILPPAANQLRLTNLGAGALACGARMTAIGGYGLD